MIMINNSAGSWQMSDRATFRCRLAIDISRWIAAKSWLSFLLANLSTHIVDIREMKVVTHEWANARRTSSAAIDSSMTWALSAISIGVIAGSKRAVSEQKTLVFSVTNSNKGENKIWATMS